MKRYPWVTISIFNFNGLEDTVRCLSSVLKTKYPKFKVLVIDDGSKTDDISILKRKFKSRKIHFIYGKKNRNFAFRVNQTFSIVKTKYVLLLNNDTVVDKNWLVHLIEVAEKDPLVAACQPKIKSMGDKDSFEYAGACGGFIDRLGYPFARGRVIFEVEKDKGQYDDEREIFWASGAAILIRKSVIASVGKFDENLIAYGEETDFCWRLLKMGFKIKSVPKSVVYHEGAASWRSQSARKIFLIHRNHLAIFIKHAPLTDLVFFLPIRIGMDYLSIFYYLRYHNFQFGLSVLKAHFSLLKFLPYVIKSRSKGNNPTTAPFSIVWDYFIRRKKTYSEVFEKRKTIAYLVLNTKKSTGTNIILEQAKQFVQKGYNVKIYKVFGSDPTWVTGQVKIESLLKSFLRTSPDVLIATFWPTSYFVYFLMKAKSKFYFSQDWEEDFHKNPIVRFFARRTYRLPLVNITNSNYVTEKIRMYKEDSSLVYTARYCVLDTFLFHPRRKIINKIHGHKKIKVLSVVSWYNAHKGPDILVNVVSILKKEHPNYHFTLVSREAKPYDNIFDRFVSDPKVDEIVKLYQTSDILLATSRTEGFFIPGIEAMACGCTFVTTNSKGILDYSVHNKNAIILKNPSELWERNIIDGLMGNGKLREKIRKNGFLTAMKYDKKYLIEDFEKILFAKNKI